MKHIVPLFTLLAFMAAPVAAVAQEEGTPVAFEAYDDITPERMALAKEMQSIWPVRTRVEAAIDTVSQSFPVERQAEVKAAVRKSIQYDQLEEESIRALAATFTDQELKAMIDFYGSEVGRAISVKTTDYELALRPVLVKMMDKAMLDLRTGSPR